MRQEITRLVHDVDRLFAVRDSDMNVQAKSQTDPRNLLHVIYDCGVALVCRDQLIHPMRKGMRAGGGYYQPVLRRNFGQLSAKCSDLPSRVSGIAANLGADFHNRLM